MAYSYRGSEIGLQPLTVTDTVQNHALGKTCIGYDPTYGEGVFIYLKGVASTVAGDWVRYDEAFATTRVTAGIVGALAIAMSANVANQYGWYQVRGMAVATAGTIAADAKLQTVSTGSCDDTTTAARDILGAVSQSADGTPAAGQAIVFIDFPTAQGTIV